MEGQDMFYKRIRREGIVWNHKRIARVYRLMGLNKKKRTRKRIPARVKLPLAVPSTANETWSMDFMADRLMNGRRFRVLNIIDDYNREALRIEPYFSITSARVVRIIERLITENKKPLAIRVDNGPEFIADVLSQWCKDNGIDLQFIQPGRPMQNGFIERFNRSYRQDVLDANLFANLFEVKMLSDEFEEDYNFHRPHESLGDLAPVEYRLKHAAV
jgi:putative transposase